MKYLLGQQQGEFPYYLCDDGFITYYLHIAKQFDTKTSAIEAMAAIESTKKTTSWDWDWYNKFEIIEVTEKELFKAKLCYT